MATGQLERLVRGICRRVREPDSDGELLVRFCRERDGGSFTELVRRHGPTVLGVCRRVLGDHHAAEDAFQAAFLVLARRAGDVDPPGAVGAWLYGVAYRTALKARGRAFRRKAVEQEYVVRVLDQPVVNHSDAADADLRAAIDEHLNALPARYRLPLVLCGVQGMAKSEAAEQLGVPEGTVSSRLARGRAMLRDRLVRKGFVVPAVGVAALLSPQSLAASVPSSLTQSVSTLGPSFAAGSAAGVSAEVLTLTHEVLRTMSLIKLQVLGLFTVIALIAGSAVGNFSASAEDKTPPKPGTAPDRVKVADGEKPKPGPDGEKLKPRPDGEKVKKPGAIDGHRINARVEKVDGAAGTITVVTKTDKGNSEREIKLAADAKVSVDGKPAKVSDIPVGSFAQIVIPEEGKEAVGVMVNGPRLSGLIIKVEGSNVTIGPRGEESKETRAFTVASDMQFFMEGKQGTVADLKPGMFVGVQLAVDGKTALVMKVGPGGEGEKPTKVKPDGEKPATTKPAGEKPTKVKPEGEKPATTKPAGEKPTKVKPEGEKPATTKPVGEK